MNNLIINQLAVKTEDKEILHGVDLEIKKGEIHAIMGPNGAGKTTLVMTLMGHPSYKVTSTDSHILINGEDIINQNPEERAKRGLFVSFQSPIEIQGVSLLAFLRTAYKSLHPNDKIPLSVFKETVKRALLDVSLPENFMSRSVNEGFSGGERKRAEIVQLLVLKPQFAVLDEIDSGLDVDSLKSIAQTVLKSVKEQNIGILVITHYQRILHYLRPDFVHILKNGKIVKSDGMRLVKKIEKEGYATI